MRVKSKVDLWISIIIWTTVAIIAASAAIIPDEVRIIGFAAGLPIVLLLLWIYFGTYYELRDDHLYCKSGPFFERIRYDRVKSAKLSHNMMSSMALSLDRIEIRQIGKGYVMGTTFISPENREEFLKQFIIMCSNLDKDQGNT